MINLIALYFVFSNFTLKWHIPVGCASGSSGKILVGDTDRDGHFELYFSNFHYGLFIHICELHLPDTWQYDSFATVYNQIAWDIGDFDRDGLCDILQIGHVEQPDPADIFFVTESPDSFSYPTNEVWRDTVGTPMLGIGDEVFDIDRDGYPELVKNEAEPYGNLAIYEFSSDNEYELIFSDTSSYGGPLATHAFGDFDQDGLKEVVFAGSNDTYWIYESPSNNNYERLYFGFLPTGNIRDCVDVADADGDGKWEFVIKGFAVFGTIDAFIFESIGNNVYDTVKVFRFPGGDYHGGHSDAGDVDGDSIPEIVLEGRQTVHIIKAAGNDSFYVWQTLPGSTYGMNIKIFDLDDNGYAEIIMSSEWQTWIYEWQPGGVEEGKFSDVPLRTLLQGVFPNPVSDRLRISYQLAGGGVVKLAVYDVAGRCVRSLAEAYADPGYYQVVWDSRDDQGRSVPAGVYFVRLETDKYCHSEKAILMR